MENLDQLLRQLAEERQLREKAEAEAEKQRSLLAEERQRGDEERRRGDEERRRGDEERHKTRKTTLPEYLDGCHAHLFLALRIQQDRARSTQGDPSNAQGKRRPDRIRHWDTFLDDQRAVWTDLIGSDFPHQRLFTSLQTLGEMGSRIGDRRIASELDLHHFARSSVEDPVSDIITELFNNKALRKKFNLKGSIVFENHANSLSPHEEVESNMQNMHISGPPRRRSPRLNAGGESVSDITTTRRAHPRPRADQFCVYNTTSEFQNVESRVAAFIIEYKAPHKLRLGHINQGLGDLDVEDVVVERADEDSILKFQRLTAAAITQVFSYMVSAGLEFGYIFTAEAIIFLRVPDDPRTVYYFLSVPSGDVGEETGWVRDTDAGNRLHLTAVGQVLAFTLQALKAPRRQQEWFRFVDKLKVWNLIYEDILESAPEPDIESSIYRPPTAIGEVSQRDSPIRLRPRRRSSSGSCSSSATQRGRNYDDPPPRGSPGDYPRHRAMVEDSSHGMSSKASGAKRHQSANTATTQGKERRYCTQGCLKGLLSSGPLDMRCPNVQEHGAGTHPIDQRTFVEMLKQQLSRNLDTDVQAIGIHGARSALFKITLTSLGYTVAAKLTTEGLGYHLRREATIYKRLLPIQGVHVPVHLGNIQLNRPYHYDGIAELTHAMFLSFGGILIHCFLTAQNRDFVVEKATRSLEAIHRLGILPNDRFGRNILWNGELNTAFMIDFDRAQKISQSSRRPSRPPLVQLSPNRKRKSDDAFGESKISISANESEKRGREIKQMKAELRVDIRSIKPQDARL